MGGVVGRPRRGLPDNPRYLPPGRYVRDVRDGDVLVLCSADAPLNLTVVPGRHPDDDGAWLGTSNERGENDPEYALVRGAAAGAGGLVGSVVVDMRGRWATLRSPAAGDRYLLVDELARARDFARLETGQRGGASSGRGDRNLMGLRFRERRRAKRSACWGVEHLGESDRAIVILRNREVPELCLRAVGPHPRTKSAAAVVLADFLREELASQMETRARLLALERSIDVERDAALEKLVAIRREHASKSRALVHARRREGMLDAEEFLDGLTGVVDALRDQVKGASAEPFADLSGGTRGNPTRGNARGGNARVGRGALGFGIDDDDDGEEAAGSSPQSDDDASRRAKHRVRTPDGRSVRPPRAGPPPTVASSEGWRVDADHLARVSKCWDLDVVEFRERLRERDIDDDAVASLQEAIRESAYEHFVVTGMRRYLLNRDKGDGGEGGGFGEDSEDDVDVDDDSSMMTGSVVSSPGSRGVVSRISSGDDLAKRAKAEERRERRAARRAALRARIRAGGAAVDFRRFKVGSLRDQLERSGVDSGPLAMLVHSLAHAMREGRPKKRRGGFLGRLARNILRGSDSDDDDDDDEKMKKKRGDAAAGGRAKKPPSETEDDGERDGDRFVRSGETFRAVLAQEKLSTALGFVRAEDRARGEYATTYEHRAPVAAGSLDAARVRRDALRAAAAAAANAARDLRANPAHDPETAAVVNFVGGLSLDDLRQELEGHSLLARGLDECVEALLETEWVGGVDGYVERRGERERALRHITVDAFRKRLERHGLEGSMLELNLVTNALAKTLADEGAARVANAEKRRLSSGAALTNASPRQPKTPRPTRMAES